MKHRDLGSEFGSAGSCKWLIRYHGTICGSPFVTGGSRSSNFFLVSVEASGMHISESEGLGWVSLTTLLLDVACTTHTLRDLAYAEPLAL